MAYSQSEQLNQPLLAGESDGPVLTGPRRDAAVKEGMSGADRARLNQAQLAVLACAERLYNDFTADSSGSAMSKQTAMPVIIAAIDKMLSDPIKVRQRWVNQREMGFQMALSGFIGTLFVGGVIEIFGIVPAGTATEAPGIATLTVAGVILLALGIWMYLVGRSDYVDILARDQFLYKPDAFLQEITVEDIRDNVALLSQPQERSSTGEAKVAATSNAEETKSVPTQLSIFKTSSRNHPIPFEKVLGVLVPQAGLVQGRAVRQHFHALRQAEAKMQDIRLTGSRGFYIAWILKKDQTWNPNRPTPFYTTPEIIKRIFAAEEAFRTRVAELHEQIKSRNLESAPTLQDVMRAMNKIQLAKIKAAEEKYCSKVGNYKVGVAFALTGLGVFALLLGEVGGFESAVVGGMFATFLAACFITFCYCAYRWHNETTQGRAGMVSLYLGDGNDITLTEVQAKIAAPDNEPPQLNLSKVLSPGLFE